MANSVAEDLRNRRLNIWNEAKGILQDAADENRDMSAEEQGRWEGRMVEIDKLDARLKGVLEAEQRSKDTDKAFDSITSKRPEIRAHADSTGRDIQGEVRGFLKGEAGSRGRWSSATTRHWARSTTGPCSPTPAPRRRWCRPTSTTSSSRT